MLCMLSFRSQPCKTLVVYFPLHTCSSCENNNLNDTRVLTVGFGEAGPSDPVAQMRAMGIDAATTTLQGLLARAHGNVSAAVDLYFSGEVIQEAAPTRALQPANARRRSNSGAVAVPRRSSRAPSPAPAAPNAENDGPVADAGAPNGQFPRRHQHLPCPGFLLGVTAVKSLCFSREAPEALMMQRFYDTCKLACCCCAPSGAAAPLSGPLSARGARPRQPPRPLNNDFQMISSSSDDDPDPGDDPNDRWLPPGRRRVRGSAPRQATVGRSGEGSMGSSGRRGGAARRAAEAVRAEPSTLGRLEGNQRQRQQAEQGTSPDEEDSDSVGPPGIFSRFFDRVMGNALARMQGRGRGPAAGRQQTLVQASTEPSSSSSDSEEEVSGRYREGPNAVRAPGSWLGNWSEANERYRLSASSTLYGRSDEATAAVTR